MNEIHGRIYSYTDINVATSAQPDNRPFTLVLVDTDHGTRLLGRMADGAPPVIGATVTAPSGETPVFRIVEEQS